MFCNKLYTRNYMVIRNWDKEVILTSGLRRWIPCLQYSYDGKKIVDAVTEKEVEKLPINKKDPDRNFVTAVRAMSDFLLKPEDLAGLRKTQRRSAHSNEPPITVFWRKDVEAKVKETFGSIDAMKKERAKRLEEIEDYSTVVQNIRKLLQEYKSYSANQSSIKKDNTLTQTFIRAKNIVFQEGKAPKDPVYEPDPIDKMKAKDNAEDIADGKQSALIFKGGRAPYDANSDPFSRMKPLQKKKGDDNLWKGSSGRIVLIAVTINGVNCLIKFLAWWITGSHSLFAESIHSLADTINQCILAYGIHKSNQRADTNHPYGYSNMKYVASLISGIGIFCIGSGLSIYHGITGLMHIGPPMESFYWGFFILAGSFVSEAATLFLAVNSCRKRAKALKIPFKEFITRSQDPSLNVVMLEDTAAILGVIVAAGCMGMTMYTGSSVADACGSLVIGGLLGVVASFIVYSNSSALIGRSIPRYQLENINLDLEQDIMIRAIHDVKGMDMGNSLVRYKAEVDFDGRELTKVYLGKQDINILLEDIQKIKTKEEVEEFVLKHGENIIDTLGAEVDRIETRLKKDHPEIRHCDLEIL